MEAFIVDLSAARKEGQLITVGIHISYNPDFALDVQHFVPMAILVIFVRKENLLSFDIHSVSSEDVQDEVIDLWVLPYPLSDRPKRVIALFQVCIM